MSVELLTEHHLGFLSLKGGCTGSSESTLVKMPYCWKSHVAAQLLFCLASGKSGGVVRVTNRKTAERTLLKDFVGRVIDLAFAHTDDVILAVVDEIGNLCVYEIKETDDRKIEYPLMQFCYTHKSRKGSFICVKF